MNDPRLDRPAITVVLLRRVPAAAAPRGLRKLAVAPIVDRISQGTAEVPPGAKLALPEALALVAGVKRRQVTAGSVIRVVSLLVALQQCLEPRLGRLDDRQERQPRPGFVVGDRDR